MPNPEPCPHCGSRPLLREIMGRRESPLNCYELYCPVCGISSGLAFSAEAAAVKWKGIVNRSRDAWPDPA